MFSARQPPKATLILIVEDDFLLRESLSLILAGEGYRVAVAENGAEALKRLHTGERPHLILLDLLMPVIDGWKLCEELKCHPELAAIPVVIMSAAGELKDRPLPPGAADYLQKPAETAALLSAVARHAQPAGAASSQPLSSGAGI